MFEPLPVVLEQDRIRLEPMLPDHKDGIIAAATDGALWNLWYTAVPSPTEAESYIATALRGQQDGHMLPWVIRDLNDDAIIGSTRYHDIISSVRRVEIGYTFYARRHQKSHVNTQCKLMLMTHAFETLGACVVGFQTDRFNLASQKAIAALGAKCDGVMRNHRLRKDGTIRDSVMYSVVDHEWPGVKRHLAARLERLRA